MSQSEAWVVTALGMTVVCVGLLLCVALIQVLSRLSARITWAEGARGDTAPAPAAPAPPGEPVPADILAVIATAIEVERKLYVSRPNARRPAPPA